MKKSNSNNSFSNLSNTELQALWSHFLSELQADHFFAVLKSCESFA